jgi:hypothetical protein
MTVTQADIESFAEFARRQAGNGGGELTVSQLAARWELDRARDDIHAAIREGLADVAAGRTEPFFASQEEFRRQKSLCDIEHVPRANLGWV